MTPNYKLDQFIGKTVSLNVGNTTTQKIDGVLVEFNAFGLLLEGSSKSVMFYPWHAITNIDVTQAYGQLKVA